MLLGLPWNSGRTCKAGFLGLSQGVTPDCNNRSTKCTKRYVQLHRGVHPLILHFGPGKFQSDVYAALEPDLHPVTSCSCDTKRTSIDLDLYFLHLVLESDKMSCGHAGAGPSVTIT